MKRLLCAIMAFAALLPTALTRAEELKVDTPMVAAVLMDVGSDTILYSSFGDAPFDVAGLVKLPAILTLAEAFDEGVIAAASEMRVSARAAKISGPTAFLSDGETICAGELMKAAVMISAGDAIVTLGENAFGSESVFVDNINATLRLAGVERTMTDACGTGMQFSAQELAKLGKRALESGTYQKYCLLYRDFLKHSDGRETELVNANRMIRSYTGCKGLVTGSAGTSTYCGVFAAERSGTAFIAVVIGADTANARFEAAETMLNFGFANFVSKRCLKAGEVVVPELSVQDGTEKTVQLIAREEVRLLLPKSAERDLRQTLETPDRLIAPIDDSVALGRIVYQDAEGTVLAEIPLYADRSVEAFGWRDVFSVIAAAFLAGG